MKHIRRFAHLVAIVLMSFAGAAAFAEDQPQNLISNGGFEDGARGWNWGQWKGFPEPGFADRDDPYEGKASYTMGLTGVEGERLLYSYTNIDPAKDHELSVVMRGKGLLKQSVSVSLLQWGTEKGEKLKVQGWVSLAGQPDVWKFITTGGTFGWRPFKVHIYRQTIKSSTKRLTLYIRNASIGQGELGIDEVSLIPVEPVEYRKPALTKKKEPAPAKKKEPDPEKKKPGPAKAMNKPQTAAIPEEPESKPGKELLLAPCDSTKGWSLNPGKEFPGAKGELMTEEVDGRKVLKVTFDLSGGGRYAGPQRAVAISAAHALVVDMRSPGWRSFLARIRDATGQIHAAGFKTRTDGWERIELALAKKQFQKHWGGAKDGKIHFPIHSVLIAPISAEGPKGTFWLRSLGVLARQPQQTWQIEVSTDQPGHIHFTNEPKVNVSTTIRNRLREERKVTVTIEVFDLEGKNVASSEGTFSFDPWAALDVHLGIDSPGPGYFYVSVTVGDGTAEEKGEGAFGVVPRPLRYAQRDPQSFFGMSCDPISAARIGVHWSRRFHFWKYSEYHQGAYTYATDHVKKCLAAGIDVMMLLDYREPGWLDPKTGEDGLPTEEALDRYADFVRDAVRAHPGVAVFEIQNEPNLELGASRNLPVEEAVEFYLRIVKRVAPIIREEAPHALICGCTVSGGDYLSNFPFSRPVLRKVGRYFDIFGPHPYASPRIFGPGLRPAFPVDNTETEKHRAAFRLLQEFDGPRKMWIGEKGWAIKDEAPLQGEISKSFANCAARSLIIAKSSGAEKYIWHMQTSNSYGEGGRYALFRGAPLQPMPGAVAYASVAHHLDHAQPVGSFKMAGGTIQANVFNRPQTKTSVATLWSVRKPFAMKAKLPKGARVFDLYGRHIAAENIELTGAPVFIQAAGADVDALLAGIKEASLAPGRPFEVILASLVDVSTLRLGLVNQTADTLPLQSRLGEQTKRIILSAVTGPTWIDIGLRAPVTQRAGRPLQLTLAAGQSKPQPITVATDVLPVTRRASVTVDGNAKDWKDVPVIVVDTRGHIQPPDPAGWNGPQDLSARASLAWDDRNLYMLVRVTDDKHVTPNLQAYWVSDSLQIAVDIMNDARETAGFDDDDREYGVVVDAKGTHIYQTHPRDPRPNFHASAKRTGSETVYEMAFPWADLGRRPRPGMVFSLNFIANENDGAGRKYWMGITPGIGEGKRPSVYRDFYLAK